MTDDLEDQLGQWATRRPCAGGTPPLLFTQALAEIVRLREDRETLLEALAHYGNPDSYFAVAVFPDRPAGWFADDLDDDHGHGHYDRPMHGSLARKTIQEVLTDKELEAILGEQS